MHPRLPRRYILIACAAILALLLACEGDGARTYPYQVCESTDNGTACHTIMLTHDECLARFSADFCG